VNYGPLRPPRLVRLGELSARRGEAGRSLNEASEARKFMWEILFKKIYANKEKFLKSKKGVYAGIFIKENDSFYLAVEKNNKITTEHIKKGKSSLSKKITSHLSSYANKNKVKFIAIGLAGIDKIEKICSDLWLDQDIVPYNFNNTNLSGQDEQKAKKICKGVANKFDDNNLVRVNLSKNRQVNIPELAELADYKKTVNDDEYKLLLSLAEDFKDKKLKMAFFNSTAYGGGVAIMRHSLIRLYRLLGLDISWYVMEAKQEIFDITKKKFHNILQGIASPDIKLTEKDKQIFDKWSSANAKRFKEIFKKNDVIIIDDPQPSGMIPYIKKINPKAKIIYRSHIQIPANLTDKNKLQQLAVWNFIWKNIKQANIFISHPVLKFIPKNIPKKKTILMPAATDPLDGLNKKLSSKQMDYYFNLFNSILKDNKQTALDKKRPYIVQIARFDPSKGIPHVIESYRKLRKKLNKKNLAKEKIPQLIITGNGSVDDPEGEFIYSEIMQLLDMDTYKPIACDIKIAKLPHYDQILNTLLRGSLMALQLSIREGFEVKISEALIKGKPVIAYKTGGIPLQIKHGLTGYLIKVGDTTEVANYMYDLLTDKKQYRIMSKRAKEKINHDYFIVNNAYKWLWLAIQLTTKNNFSGDCSNINNIINAQRKLV